MPTVLIVGGGGREHALADALARSAVRPDVIVAPGNAGISAPWRRIAVNDVDGWMALARAENVDLAVIGPEAPLVAGLADRLRAEGVAVVGPSAAASELEGSKTFAKEVMQAAGVPTARWGSFTDAGAAEAFARTLGPSVVKADGLAAGKGVVVADGVEDAVSAIGASFDGAFGEAGQRVVVEERLLGEELSVMALSDGERLAVLAPSQDHKRVGEGDRGPNTGGMGAYSPTPRASSALMTEIEASCLRPVIAELARRGRPFSGVLYAGLMLTAAGAKVLEYNVRFGDPEAQAILPRLACDAYELFMSAAEGRLDPDAVRFDPRSAMTVVLASEGYPAKPRTGDAIEGLEAAAALPDVRIYHAGTAVDAGRIVTSGGRVLGITGLGDDLAAAAARAYAAVDRIRWPGMHFRRDIGFRALGPSGG